MMETEHGIADTELHAFIDGELEPRRAAEIAAAIERSPALAQRAAAFGDDKAGIARAFGPLIDLPLPPAIAQTAIAQTALAQAARTANRDARRQFGRVRLAAAGLAAAAAIAALVAAPALMRRGGTDALVDEALAAREGRVGAQTSLAAPTMPAEDQRNALIGQTLGVRLRAPDLRRAGFDLVGVAIYRAGSAAAVELRYRDAKDRLFTVYLHKPAGPDAFELREAGVTRICIWRNDELSAVMIADMSTGEMLRVATLTYSDLNF